jgi:hypothetical protein
MLCRKAQKGVSNRRIDTLSTFVAPKFGCFSFFSYFCKRDERNAVCGHRHDGDDVFGTGADAA